ncbi:uncharacterized protein F4812DRAFT_328068 [Daldinia caldariorum]|uniref:uncharacterized protein n=1 Tax=Daldinia caldariorum TaxID=326644 RepID=UPI002008C64D|nr:uncharacterized protein F4812DRAFT_328068 [Daldinia caldariorum]KAI1469389.1 hypothetical protein F4812DRAFT_328068 [Daldinia caldariorum]
MRFALLHLFLSYASAAYVQWQHCDGYTPDESRFVPETLSTSLIHTNKTHDRLSLVVGRRTSGSGCEEWATRIAATDVELDQLRSTSIRRTTPNITCQQIPTINQSRLIMEAAIDTRAFHSFSTFHTTIHLIDHDANENGCLQANITPEITPALRGALRYVPLSILFFVLLIGIARSVQDSLKSSAASLRAVLPGFADCLQYLQFIFLTGSLSLFYPGFYQPAVSRLGWMSLFADDLVPSRFAYKGIHDGIYEINGTYGGTFGLELMTQIVGAPTIMDTWVNMVVLIVVIAAFSALCLEIFWLSTRPDGSDTGLLRTFNRTLHVVLSYFMLPLIALSCYQLDNASYLPYWHILYASAFILSILVAFVWLFFQIPMRSLGILIFNGRKQYRQVSSSDGLTQQHKSFIIVLFVLVFIRGIAIGGLQISGKAQLVVLAACELVLLASIIQFQAYSLFSIDTVSAIIRLGTLLCMVAFVPGVASDNARSAVGYLILFTHACVLVFGFFIPALIQLGKLCYQHSDDPAPSVYGLRQLRRREAVRINLPDRPESYPSPENDSYRDSSVYLESAHHSGGSSGSHRDSASTSSWSYYRPPRHSRISPQHSMNPLQDYVQSQQTYSENQSVYCNSANYSRPSSDTGSSGSSESGSSSPVAATDTDTKSLHPRWGDYSFRESDLYYGTPGPTETGRIALRAPEAATSMSSRRSFSLQGLWAGVSRESRTTERGFSVVRPPRPSNLPS